VNVVTWINTIPYTNAEGRLRQLYDRIKGPDDNVDNIMLAHSLRPHTLEGHMTLYKYVLHHPRNTIPKWFLEALGIYTSMLNHCGYCVEHHYSGVIRLLGDKERSEAIRAALESAEWAEAFSKREIAALTYAHNLTLAPSEIVEDDVLELREAGWEDGEILEINQVCAYFAYANRTVLGLGIDTAGDILGLSPGDSTDPDNWQHQ
jgi:uncharacterized peroxidase-related enzyme